MAAPLTAMFTVDCVPPFVTELIECSLRDLGHLKRFEFWRKIWRSQREFEEGIPILWPNFEVQLQVSRPLSPASSRVFTFYFGTVEFHAKPVEQKYESKASKSPPSAGEQRNVVVVFFSHYWLVVNTRDFYYLLAASLQRPR